jgi:two-component system nitrate/nitrite response regulator NarL
MTKDRSALTVRELQVTALVAQGLSNKEIGRMLNIADSTIKVHLHNIFLKLGVRNRTALALMTKALPTPVAEAMVAPALAPAD